MNLSRSTYYHKPKNASGDDDDLIAEIEALIVEFPGYGYRRVTQELHRRGKPINHKKGTAHHARAWTYPKNKTALDSNYGQQSLSSGLPESYSEPRRNGPKPSLGGGYHLYRNPQ